jgi:hypothetical protein
MMLLATATALADDEPLQLTLELADRGPDAAAPQWEKPLPLNVTLTNISDTPQTVSDGNPWKVCEFTVETVPRAENHRIDELSGVLPQGFKTRYALRQIEDAADSELTEKMLQPDESIEFQIDLTRCFNLSKGGRYQITARRNVGEDDDQPIEVVSEPFEVWLIPKPSVGITHWYAYPKDLVPPACGGDSGAEEPDEDDD